MWSSDGSSDHAIGNIGWRTYERIVAWVEANSRDIDFSITPNARIRGCISGRMRQIDVLVDLRWSDYASARTIVDAKFRKRKVDIRDVESLIGMMADCRASRGILVCPLGHTAAALARAQDAVAIRLLDVNEMDEFPWGDYEPCLGRCSNREFPERRGLVLWDAHHRPGLHGVAEVIFSGKCDVCHEFHAWCWACGERFAVPAEGHRRCGCKGRIWASLIEDDIADGRPNAAHLLVVDEAMDLSKGPLALDRRALR